MTERYYHVHIGVRCDVCGATTEGPGVTDSEHYTRLAVEAGWRIFVSRYRRFYCPNCSPKPRHKMREITDRYRRTALAGEAQ